MTPDDIGKQLHDKATRGISLSAEEEKLLAAWYARHDEEEARQLAAAPPPPHLGELRQKIDAALAEIIAVAQRIQTVNRENEALRNEIAILQQRLSQKAL